MSRQIIEDGLDYLAELKGVRISSVELNELTDKIYDSLDYIAKERGLINEDDVAHIWGNTKYIFGTNRLVAIIEAAGRRIGVAKFAYRSTGYMDNLRTVQVVQTVAGVMKTQGDDVQSNLPLPHTAIVFDRTRGKEYFRNPYQAYKPGEFDTHALHRRAKDNEGFALIIEEYGTPLVKNEGDSFYETMYKMWKDIRTVTEYEETKKYLSQFIVLSDLSPNDKGIYNTCAFERAGGKLIAGFLDVGSCVVKADNRGNVIFGNKIKYRNKEYIWDMGDLTYEAINNERSGKIVLEKLESNKYLHNLLNKYTCTDKAGSAIADIDMVDHAIAGILEYVPFEDDRD